MPGYLERINIIINLKDNESSKAFLVHLLDRLRYILVRTLPYTVNRILFLGDVSFFQEKFEEFKQKMGHYCEVRNYPESDFDDLLDFIDPEQLEAKFGGNRPNVEEYWPPVHHTTPKDSIDMEDLGMMRVIPYFIYDEDYETFVKEHIPNKVIVDKRGALVGGQGKGKLHAGVIVVGAKSTSETLTKAGEDRVRLRKVNMQRTHSQTPGFKDRPEAAGDNLDKVETETRDHNAFSEKPNYTEFDNSSRAPYRADRLADMRKNKNSDQGLGGIFNMLGCCGRR